MDTLYLKLLIFETNIGTYFERLPNDIIEYIITNFIYIPMKKKSMKIILPKIHLKGINSRLININKIYESYKNICIIPPLYLRHKIYFKFIEDPEYFLNVLNTCECCCYHNSIKPKSLYNNIQYNSYTIAYNFDICKCKCLYECKLIYNTFTYNLNVL